MSRFALHLLIASLLMSGFVHETQAAVLSYSGTLYDDGVQGAALFNGIPLGPSTAFSFVAEFDPDQPITALPIGTSTPIPLAPGQAAYVATSVIFTIDGIGTYTVVPGSYAVTLQDTTGPGLFGYFFHQYAVGIAELVYPGAGAMLASFGTATPAFVAADVIATTLTDDLGAIAEMYVPFTSGDFLAFFLPAPVAGTASATIVPEPPDSLLFLPALAAIARVRTNHRRHVAPAA